MMKFPRSPSTFASIFLLLALLWPSVGWSQQATITETKDFSLRLGERVWLSTGHTEFSIAGPGGIPRIVSELEWKNLESQVFEFRADGLFREKYLLNVAVGFGYIGAGTLRDRDFDQFNCTGLCLETESAADADKLSFIRVELGYRLHKWDIRDGKPQSSLDFLIGYQRWRERYLATRTILLVDRTSDPLPLGPIPEQGLALTEEFTWDSLVLGAQSAIELFPDFLFHAKGLFIPWTQFQLEDIHHLRTSGANALQQNPSFQARASGGYGGQIEAGLSYRIWYGLSLSVGYQFWYLKSGRGIGTFHTVLHGDVRQPLNQVETLRHGVVLGVHYTF